ncbi:aminotransferase class V [Halorhabdus utahensis DSM 12940]|uniref:Aminotransferase class V n=1 Tax=Halorhabdus utahensis (strain DSM 12940 / JCM 11049 / AX-2) TaxID=519442 RepID=C7NTY4_HALUD|nr:aminotransferase class V-fold PLP-dependent enzyme [Halorhabdus utahensis]ACV10973.1 aminotransferase class V [Halorhabdus utahensis DSM 12940]
MDLDALRHDIPVLTDTAYLNTGASSPAPRSVVEATTDWIEYHNFEAPIDEGIYPHAWDSYEAARETIAPFLGVSPETIALTSSTVHGINLIVSSIDWQPGDVVVRTDLEHPAGVLPFDRMADLHGIEVRTLETTDGRIDRDELRTAVDDARLLAMSSLTWSHGTRLPVEETVDIAHDAGARVLIDAVQSPGQRPVDFEAWDADFVAGSGHKWLLGPWGAGFLYVAPEAIDALAPRQIGYRSVEESGATSYEYKTGAPRFELGTASPAPHVGLAAAIDLLESIGMETVQTRIERLTDRLKAGLGERLISPREYESGLVTFDAGDPEATVERLADAGVIVRSLPYPEAVRASVHGFNTAEDVDRLLEAL